MIEPVCWCRHREAVHAAEGCTSCRWAVHQLLEWKHRFRPIRGLSDRGSAMGAVATRKVRAR